MSNNTIKKNFGGKFKVIADFTSKCRIIDTTSNNTYTPSYVTYATTTPQPYDEIYITKVIYRDPAIIVFWNDGTKTVSKCHGTDIYSPEIGLITCCFKKIVGATNLKNLLADWTPSTSEITYNDSGYIKPFVRTLSDIRRRYSATKV